MDAVYANCFGAPAGGVLLTEEIAVARSAPRALVVDRLVDAEAAQSLNRVIWWLAFTWGSVGGEDPSRVHDVSAIDVAGGESALTTLVPVARGVLGMQGALRELTPTSLTAAVPGVGSGHHVRIETMQARGAVEAARAQLGSALPISTQTVADPRNATLAGKYERTRDIDQLASIGGWGSRGLAERAVLHGINAAARMRRPIVRASALVLEYNPTRAFARRYGLRRHALGLVRARPDRRDLPAIAAAGDRVLVAPPAPRHATHPEIERRLRRACLARAPLLEEAFTWEGVSVWPIVSETLIRIAVRHAAYLEDAVPRLRRQLRRGRVAAALVPFDTPPEARAVVRVAQREGIETLVLSDGFKGDDFSVEGATADVALSWSESMTEHFFSRWPARTTVLTGNPRADQHRPGPRRTDASAPNRILIGSFTFSPIDLNCRRSDAEAFIEEVLAGIAASKAGSHAEIVLKLHPADEPEHYREALDRHRALDIDLLAHGDVVDCFDECDVYITTYSTSLIEAVPRGLPVIYYRVNEQRLHPPFSDDELLAPRTAASPDQLTALLDGPLVRPSGYNGHDLGAWAERYLGPADGLAVDRVAAVLEARSRSRRAASSA